MNLLQKKNKNKNNYNHSVGGDCNQGPDGDRADDGVGKDPE